MNVFPRLTAIIGVLTCLTAASVAGTRNRSSRHPRAKGAWSSWPPALSGPAHYTTVAREIAELGYDVVLFDGNLMAGTHGDGCENGHPRGAADAARAPWQGRSGRLLSWAGACLFTYGTQWPDLVCRRGALVPHKQLHSRRARFREAD
jgi:hypothetical protein